MDGWSLRWCAREFTSWLRGGRKLYFSELPAPLSTAGTVTPRFYVIAVPRIVTYRIESMPLYYTYCYATIEVATTTYLLTYLPTTTFVITSHTKG